MNGEPGFSFNFGDKQNETLRNACTEVTSEDDSDICNLGSINFARIEDITELKDVVYLASKFLVCGSMRADVPYQKVADVRERNRRLGLGVMGLHEWMLRRGYKYEMNEELKQWLQVYKKYSEVGANEHCDRFYLARPKGYRAIAPTGTTGLIASTTTGIEPLFSVAYKRRYLVGSDDWRYEYVIDSTAQHLIEELGVDPDTIETSLDLAADPERRIKFQADVQEYVDHAISSTINLPAWGTELNNEDTVKPFADLLRKYAPKLRGFTCYPDGSRGGQPLTSVPYSEAYGKTGTIYSEHDICEITGHGGSCGI
jgi:ribonucleoside-diphosphate reductase alpha chain